MRKTEAIEVEYAAKLRRADFLLEQAHETFRQANETDTLLRNSADEWRERELGKVEEEKERRVALARGTGVRYEIGEGPAWSGRLWRSGV